MRDFITDLVDTLADAAANHVVDAETDGLTESERLRRVEVKLALLDGKTTAHDFILKETNERFDSELNGVMEATMSVIFAVAGHFLGRGITSEEQKRISDRAREISKSTEGYSASDAGAVIYQAAREVLGG